MQSKLELGLLLAREVFSAQEFRIWAQGKE
jgi:hypothetical protein